MNREDWLEAAAERLLPLVSAGGADAPRMRLSCGFPDRGGMAPRRLVLGQCWPGRTASNRDGRAQIFISPLLADAVAVMGVLLHEMCHAALPAGTGHRAPFKRLATAVGLTGRMTATVPGPSLIEKLQMIGGELGPYPHTPLRHARLENPEDPESPEIPEPRQKTRLRLWECACPVKVRVASDDFQATCDRCDCKFEKKDSHRLNTPGPGKPDAPRGDL